MTGQDKAPLSEEKLTNMEKDYPEAVARYRQERGGDKEFEPKGSAPTHAPVTPDNAHAERAQLQKVLADPSRTAILDAGFRNREEAITRLDELARVSNGEQASPPDKQASADDDFRPRSQSEYDFALPGGREWSDDARQELTAVKSEMFKAGVNPQIASSVFNDFGGYAEATDQAWRQRIEGVAGKFVAKDEKGNLKNPQGPQIIADAELFLNSGLSEHMLEAAAIAAGRELGVKELARLGRQLQRKGR